MRWIAMLPNVANDSSKAERWVEEETVVKRQQKKSEAQCERVDVTCA
jgi:hypothetical protein